MKTLIFSTSGSWSPLILRFFLAFVVFPHGAQKLFGWFGGYGFDGTMGFFTETVGLPWIIGLVIILLESVGALALLAGIGTRLLAVGYLFLAVGIILTSHWRFGFFMNWFGNQGGEGFEYFILWIGMAVALIVTGGGRYSVDRSIG